MLRTVEDRYVCFSVVSECQRCNKQQRREGVHVSAGSAGISRPLARCHRLVSIPIGLQIAHAAPSAGDQQNHDDPWTLQASAGIRDACAHQISLLRDLFDCRVSVDVRSSVFAVLSSIVEHLVSDRSAPLCISLLRMISDWFATSSLSLLKMIV